MNFLDLIQHAELLAISVAISPTEESIYNIRCREYSDRFSTPLHLVYDLDPLFVIRNLFEDRFRPSEIQEEIPELLEKLYQIKDPTYTSMSKQDTEDMVDNVLNREIRRLAKKKDPWTGEVQKPSVVKNTSGEEVKEPPKKSGGVSFESLEQIDEAGEANKGGFKD